MAADMHDSEAMTYLGRMYEHGRGVKKDVKRALVWYKKAATLGDEYARKKVLELDTSSS
jgi:TPR repeat protein